MYTYRNIFNSRMTIIKNKYAFLRTHLFFKRTVIEKFAVPGVLSRQGISKFLRFPFFN